jgi:DNA-binding beta-propeller fold protein YncE
MKASGPSFTRNAALVAGLSATLALLAYGVHGARAATPIPTGTVMVGTGNGLYSEYTQTGTLITQLNTTSGSTEETGCGFDPLTGDFYSTNFEANNVSKFDPTGAFLTIFGSGYNEHPESIVFDGASPENVYVGQADGTHHILKFNTSGTPIASFCADT